MMISGDNNKYKNIEKKGEGTFSEVYKAQHVKHGTYHAIKFMKESYNSMKEVNQLKEIEALRQLGGHPNIVKLQDVLYDPNTGTLGIVFELMEKNLYELISGRRTETDRPFESSYTTNMAFQLFTAIEHIHSHRIFHRDIKPENILVNQVTKTLKLADFGSCRGSDVAQPVTGYIATRWYRAPENLLTDGHYGPPMDIWGAGSVLYEFISLYPLFSGSNEVDQLNRIHKVIGTPSARILDKLVLKAPYDTSFGFPVRKGVGIRHFIPHVSLDCVDLISKTLVYDFTKRIDAKKALSHGYFNNIRVKEKAKQRLFQTKPKAKRKVAVPNKFNTKPSTLPNLFRAKNKTTGKSKSKTKTKIGTDKAKTGPGNTWGAAKEPIIVNASSSGATRTTAPDSLQSNPSSELLITPLPSPNKSPQRRIQKALSSTSEVSSANELSVQKSSSNVSSLKEASTNMTSSNERRRRERSKSKPIPAASEPGDNKKNKLKKSKEPAESGDNKKSKSKKSKEPARRMIVCNPKHSKQAPSNTTSCTKESVPKPSRTSHKKSSTTQAKAKTQSRNVKPAKFVRPNPGSRHYGQRGNQPTMNKRLERKKKTGLDAKPKRLNNTVAQSSGNVIEEYHNNGGLIGSTAATHAGTQITGDDAMTKTIEDIAANQSSEDQYKPRQPINSDSFEDAFDDVLEERRDISPERGCGNCFSGAIPDYIFICQNWY